MARIGFCGPSYTSQSVNADAQLCQNWYPEADESGNGKSALVMYPTPGTNQFTTDTVSDGSTVRGEYVSYSTARAFAVIGTTFFEVFSNGTLNALQTGIPDDGLPVTWGENNARQLIFCAGAQLWCYPLTSGQTRNLGNNVTNISMIQSFFSPRSGRITITLTVACPYEVGALVTLAGLTTLQFNFLNGYQATVGEVSGNTFTFFWPTRLANDGPLAETGTVTGPATVPFTNPLQVNTAAGPISFVAFIDGYFICTYKDSQEFQISNQEDGTNWDPADVSKVEEFPDNILSMIVLQELIWFFGTTKSIPYFDTGNALFPFGPVQNTLVEQGIGVYTAHTAVKADNTVFWFGFNEQGTGIAWRMNGYTPTRISNHAVEWAWSQYPAGNVFSYSYVDQGHTFVVFYFSAPNNGLGATWVYDIATNMWHNRAHLSQGKVVGTTAHLSRCHMYAFGKHLVGDWRSPAISEMSIGIYHDFNEPGRDSGAIQYTPIQRIRRSPHVSTEQEWTRHIQLQVYLESGLFSFPGDPSGPQSILMADSIGGEPWLVQIANDGLPDNVPQFGTPSKFIFQDQVNTAKYYEVKAFSLTNFTTTLLASAPAQYYTFFNMATLDGTLQTGLSVQNGVVIVGTPTQAQRGPTASLRWSNDGGHTWSNYYTSDCGQVGQFNYRVMFRRLGRARDRVYELSCSDAIPWRIIDAYLKATPGFQPSERLSSQINKSA